MKKMLAAAALVLGMGAAHADDSKTLYFYNWTEYVPPGLLEQFTKETGIKVIYSTYESNETMYAKLKTYKDGAYDLVVPSTYFVDKMRKEGMRKLGYSGNTTDPKEIEAAYNELKKLMPNVAAFNSDNPANPYMEGEVNLGMVWNGSAFVARQAGTPLEVVWPKEGGIFWMDSLAIPANAKNVEGALKLINFLLRPDVAKQVAETIGYPTPNLAARKLLSPEVANDKSLYPDAETISKGEWQNDVGDASRLYEEYYQKLKAGR